MGKFIDLAGQKFGRLTVINRAILLKPGQAKWICECECGNVREVRGSDLREGKSRSCGCLRTDERSTHKLSRSSEYKIWIDMKRRCTLPSLKIYKHYGGRGISYCDRWKEFANFIEDMGSRPTESHSLDRIDVNKDYSPENCRWADNVTQSRNKRKDNATTGRKGIWIDKRGRTKKFVVNIGVNYKNKYVGIFSSLEEAIQAREEAENKYWRQSS